MRWISLVAALALPVQLATATVRPARGTESWEEFNHGLNEAERLASNAVRMLNEQWDDEIRVKAPYMQVFREADLEYVKYIYNRAVEIVRDPAWQISFYDNERHLRWSESRRSWVDGDYTYRDSRGRNRHVEVNLHDSNRQVRPGAQGNSYTTLGYRVNVGHGRVADLTHQAHIFIHPDRINPPPNANWDSRSCRRIVNDGPRRPFTSLDSIRPLSTVILHELIHVAGGLEDQTGSVGQARITDGPGESVYGLSASFDANIACTQGHGQTTAFMADPYVVLAKELYLQLRRNADGRRHRGPTMWVYGSVDPVTLQPVAPS